VEPLAVLENVEGERHLHALPLLLDAQQGALQVQPERDLLRMCRGQSHVSFHQEIFLKKAGNRWGGYGRVQITELHIYIEEVESKGLWRETGLQLPAEGFSCKFLFFF
jgi:hypothetical protein